MMDEEQEELRHLIDDPALVCNVNTQAELKAAETFLASPDIDAAADWNHRKKHIDRSTTLKSLCRHRGRLNRGAYH